MRLYLLALLLALPMTPEANAAEGICRVVHFDLRPSDDLQVVIWIEDAQGAFIDTAFITRKTGSFGLGNRPGLMDFNSGPGWCYGRRESTFPVWAHRHGLSWPQVIFQDEDDRDLSHSITESSLERTFCRPIEPTEELWDKETCATTVYTDKGKFHPSEVSLYPPRNDPDFDANRDNADVQAMISSNPFDAVSKPTPLGGEAYKSVWSIPESLPDGQYVAWIEVSKEFDQNATYDFPAPAPINWSTYGEPYRGQPSVLYQVPFEIGGGDAPGFAVDYLGYGDPEGVDGEIRPPDISITTGMAGTGAGRLLLTSSGDEMYRFRVQASSSDDVLAPGEVGDLQTLLAEPDAITLQFQAPGDDGLEGTVNSYEVRYLAGAVLGEDNWAEGTLATAQIAPLQAGAQHEFSVTGLLPNTNYSIGIRASDECLNQGPVTSISALTPRPEPGTVDACFVATAAYGSLMANEVVALRSFRDRFLRTHATGEIMVEGYYTFGPALAKLIQGSPLLRRTARAALAPAVERASALVRP